jgi:hypothetical protein
LVERFARLDGFEVYFVRDPTHVVSVSDALKPYSSTAGFFSGASPIQIESPSIESRTKQTTAVR